MAKDPTTAREALAVQMMEDIDALVRRLEEVDGELREKVGQAIKDAAGKALLQTQMNFESMMETQQTALLQAGREAAARIGNELNRSSAPVMLAAGGLRHWFSAFVATAFASAIVAGAVGGFIGYRLAAM
ncbi:hypothetical protein ALQ34_02030 [Pseudomonas syringae pv. maculicola]|uniref:hypothetical protein n=1 Tax=Pseudomonas syringae group genomosp. 3 TaxID=251701 RepID=UPI000EFE78B2|nr:hypothetical protein [Pseudomonas syringae group genomosp. 3]RMO83919.1 hypothetical protein ALQ34_02030 [Pseudomonas syringae pv. maculicola]